MSIATALDDLKRQRPEWKPWLAVVEEVLRDTATPTWDATVPDDILLRDRADPLLAGAVISVPVAAVRRVLRRLTRAATLGGTVRMATLETALDADVDVASLFLASVCQDNDRIGNLAAGSGADRETVQAVVALLPIPFLQACNRRWASSLSNAWLEGYCPVCASWPAFAEVRGIERNRYFRCGRCGSQWHAHGLSCPYCGMNDHHELDALVPGNGHSHAVIDACRRCLGYIKTFSRLQGCPSDGVLLEDLATVNLDVAALDQGYRRPQGAGCALNVTQGTRAAVVPQASRPTRRLFGWRL